MLIVEQWKIQKSTETKTKITKNPITQPEKLTFREFPSKFFFCMLFYIAEIITIV